VTIRTPHPVFNQVIDILGQGLDQYHLALSALTGNQRFGFLMIHLEAPPALSAKPEAMALNPHTHDLRLGTAGFDDANGGVSTPVEMTVSRSAAGPAVMLSGSRHGCCLTPLKLAVRPRKLAVDLAVSRASWQ
jgi:hypothetical protein